MPLGAHLPTSKGLPHALAQAQELNCDCLQIFSKSPRQWNAAPLDPRQNRSLSRLVASLQLLALVVHDSYLINLAAPDDSIREKSIAAMIDEVERAEALGCNFLVTHCGAHLNKDCTGGEEAGLKTAEPIAATSTRTHARCVGAHRAGEYRRARHLFGRPFEHLNFV
jgi:deoxyribonuclease-4